MRVIKPRVRILPYKMGSQGASKIAEGLRAEGIKCMKVFPDKAYYPKKTHFLINWGSSNKPNWYSSRFCTSMLNKPPNVDLASNKLHAFQAWESWNEAMPQEQVNIPEFTDDRDTAQKWYLKGKKVVGRAVLQGHSGKGIYVTSPLDYPQGEGGMDVVHMSEIAYGIGGRALPLYVKYIKKKTEYRVHVFKGKVIDVQQKRKKQNVEAVYVDYQVRSHARGWVFCRSELAVPPSVLEQALRATRALGLDFGAVDIIWNNHYNVAYVLEINSAPGLEGSTINSYVNAIKEIL